MAAPRLVVLCILFGCAVRAAAEDVPVGRIESVAVDPGGNVYTASRTGLAAFSPEGACIFSVAIDGVASSLAVDEDYLYCASGDQIHRFHRKTGKTAPFPGRAGRIDLGRADARGLDVSGATLYVADALGGRVRMFDTSTGTPKTEFDVHLPTAVAVDPLGQIWVATGGDTVKAFRADGYSGVTYGGLGDVAALAFGPGATLYAADARAGQVLRLDTAASPARFLPVLKNLPDCCGLAIDNHDNLITIDHAGARLARWSPDHKLAWEHRIIALGGVTIIRHRRVSGQQVTDTWTFPIGTIELINVALPRP
jgi:sugar lactone lactonase YvrE